MQKGRHVSHIRGLAAALALAGWAAASARAEAQFAGTWQTTLGANLGITVRLTQEKDRVEGAYLFQGALCSLQGQVKGSRLEFTYREQKSGGAGWFELAPDGKTFVGQWHEKDSSIWHTWVGARVDLDIRTALTFDGVWASTFGRMRLLQREHGVQGVYDYAGGSTLAGKVEGRRLKFTYQEPKAAGEGWFELSADGNALHGQWKQAGADAWSSWDAVRVFPMPGVVWLVVIEAYWESNLAQQEYSFGNMLKAFFARAPNVQVRQRFFYSEADLKQCCREVGFLAEPVVVCIASHATPEGVGAGGKTIGAEGIAEGLRYANNVRLLHFSACLAMRDKLPNEIVERLGACARFPISGYTTTVDWVASAVLEFLYFDLILVRGMSPKTAADQLRILMPFAEEQDLPNAVIRPAGFKILMPGEKPGKKP